MRSYLIDELLPDQATSLAARLEQAGMKGPVEGIIWFELPPSLLTPRQNEHLADCGPYILSLEIGSTWVKLELLVRARQTFRCDCTAFATPEQRAYVLDLVDAALADLEPRT